MGVPGTSDQLLPGTEGGAAVCSSWWFSHDGKCPDGVAEGGADGKGAGVAAGLLRTAAKSYFLRSPRAGAVGDGMACLAAGERSRADGPVSSSGVPWREQGVMRMTPRRTLDRGCEVLRRSPSLASP
jgi:hypothetical protein